MEPFRGTIVYSNEDNNWDHYKRTKVKDSVADVIIDSVNIYIKDNLDTSEDKNQLYIQDLKEESYG